jgi:thiol:disulfide interchange protein DsbD
MKRTQVTALMSAATVSILALLLGAAETASAKPWWLRGVDTNETDFLPPDVAFRVGARVEGNLLKVRWVIADGYYLYRQKIEVKAESPDLQVFAAQLPQGVMKTDPYLGTQEIYTQQVEAGVPFTRIDAGAHPIQIRVTYQGCAQAGLCYPPITKVVFPADGVAANGLKPVATGVPAHPWEGIAIIAGLAAFLFAGLVLRKGRKLDLPV